MQNGFQKEFKMTDKVMVGKIVDAIRTGGFVDITHPLYPMAKDIAERIRAEVGDKFLSKLTSQLSYTADLETFGIQLKVKGRPDWELAKLAIFDLKVTFSTDKDLGKLIEFMKYDNQLYNYRRLANIDKSFLIMHQVSSKKTFIFHRLKNEIDLFNADAWWEDKILEYGKAE